jgi:hypothetical protein
MGNRLNHSGSPSGYKKDLTKTNLNYGNNNERKKEDNDLIIEDNTVYEIDRECYERLKRQRKRKTLDNKSI